MSRVPGALHILLVIKVWTYTFQLAKLKNHKYERCKEIEEKLGLQQHRTVKWPSGRQKTLYSAVMSLFIVIWLIVAWTHLKPLLCQHSALTGAVFLDCKLPNVASSEFLIDVNKSRVLNSQEFVDPDGSKIPSFNVLSIESDNIQLIRGYEGMLKGTKGRIKELIYINRYNLRATDRVWLNDAFVRGGDGACKVVEKKL